jgi:hypothetical protein
MRHVFPHVSLHCNDGTTLPDGSALQPAAKDTVSASPTAFCLEESGLDTFQTTVLATDSDFEGGLATDADERRQCSSDVGKSSFPSMQSTNVSC